MIEILNENEETEIIGGTIPVQAFATNIEVNPGISQYIGETDPIFKASPAFNITNSDIINWNNKASEGYVDTKLMTKQDSLVSGTNIKTINNNSLLGSGNIEIEGATNYNELENKPKINNVELSGNKSLTDLGIDLSTKQDTLVSGTNIKTINNNSILGSGNINIEAPEYTAGAGIYIDNQSEISVKLGQGLFIDSNAAIRLNNDTLNKLESIATKQDILESGTNIKTINNESILGSGNLEIGGGDINVNNSYSTSQTDTYSCNYINGLETYSTSETRIGTWVDNKPLYRKVITTTTPSSTGVFSNSGFPLYVNHLTRCDIFIDRGTYISSYNGNSNIWFTFNKIDHNFICDAINPAYQNKPMIIIFEYTKTTD